MLLDAGGRIERDEYGMTPILSAAMVGHRDVVSLFLTMCSRDEQIDALKLIGSTYVDKRRDLSSAIAVWRDAVRLQAGVCI
jgi:ankyrin repeat protein